MATDTYFFIGVRGVKQTFDRRNNNGYYVKSELAAQVIYERMDGDFLTCNHYLPNQSILIELQRVYKTKDKTVFMTLEKKNIVLGPSN